MTTTIVGVNDPGHPVAGAYRMLQGAPECRDCGWVMHAATKKSTRERYWVCLHCPYIERMDEAKS